MTRRWRRTRMVVAAAALGSLLVGGAAALAAPGGNSWNSAGGDRQNTRHAASESKISPSTVASLTKKWELTTGGDVSATPAVDGQRVYVPDWAGNLYAVDRATGCGRLAEEGLRPHRRPGRPGPGDARLHRDHPRPRQPGPVLRRWRDGRRGGQGHGRPALAHAGRESRGRDHHAVRDDLRRSRLRRDLVAGGGACRVRPARAAPSAAASWPSTSPPEPILWRTYMTPEGYPGNAVWGSSPAVDVEARLALRRHGQQLRRPRRRPPVHR